MNNIQVIDKKAKSGHNILWYTFMTIVMFCYIYQFRLTIFGLPEQLHSIRIATLVLYTYYFISLFSARSKNYNEGKRAIRFYRRLIIIHIAIFLYMLILYLSIGFIEGTHMVTVLINFFFITLIPIYLCSRIFDSVEDFCFIILLATLLQTAIIWLSTVFPNIGTVIDFLFNNAENYEWKRRGYSGGIGCITAPGYIRYSLGQIACCYLYLRKKETKYLLIFLIMLLTGSMIARTGLLGGSLGLLFMLLYNIRARKITALIPIMFVTLFVIITADVLLSDNIISEFFGERFHRMNDLVENSQSFGFFNDDFFVAYFHGDNTVIPPITWETIIGTGVPSGTAGNGIEVNVDGGWFRLYVAYGLILAILFYLYFFGYMLYETLQQKDLVIKYTFLLTFIILVMAEFKEWTIYESPFLFFYTAILILAPKESLPRKTLTSNMLNFKK